MGLPQPTEGAPFDGAALREAHARLARELHPASKPSCIAAIAHKRMVEAYAVLSDAERSAYDASLIPPATRVELHSHPASSAIIRVGVRRPPRPGASIDLTVTLAWHTLCVHVAASRLLWRSSS